MQALMLVAGRGDLLPQFRMMLQSRFPTATIADYGNLDEFVVQFFGHNEIFIQHYGQDLSSIGWDVNEAAFITKFLPIEQHVYSVGYRSIAFARQAIISIADSPETVVDNDCGTLLIGQDFVRKVLAEPDWNWFDDL